MDPTVGMKVKVVGRYADFTDHLDGQVVTVVSTAKADNGTAERPNRSCKQRASNGGYAKFQIS